MNVVAGCSYETPVGEWRKVSVMLDETDVKRLTIEGRMPEDPSTNDKFMILSAEAEILLTVQLARLGHVSRDVAAARIKALRGG
jgi:hypothetical protein